VREAQAKRTQAAREAATRDIFRRWAGKAMERADLTQYQVGEDARALMLAGVPVPAVEQAVAEALTVAASAYRAALVRAAAEAVSDSENTDTGRFRTV
jgi:hypothetical protein